MVVVTRRAAGLVALVVSLAGCDRSGSSGDVSVTDLGPSYERLRADFRADSGRVRALVIGGPT